MNDIDRVLGIAADYVEDVERDATGIYADLDPSEWEFVRSQLNEEGEGGEG